MAVKKEARPFGFEATFYIAVHGRILAKIKEPKMNQFWVPTTLLPNDQNECLIPHLKDLIRVCLEPEAQRCGRTFRVNFFSSKHL